MKNKLYKKYKTLVFFQPEIEKNEMFSILSKYYKLISNCGSQFFFQNLGRRNLSYKIKGFSNIIYIQLIYEGNNKLIQELSKNMSINEKIIRHITIKD